jgi:hypothetical protein
MVLRLGGFPTCVYSQPIESYFLWDFPTHLNLYLQTICLGHNLKVVLSIVTEIWPQMSIFIGYHTLGIMPWIEYLYG